MKHALILTDIQNDFLPGGALAVSEGDQIVPIINSLMDYPFDLIIATQDWHPQDHGSFAPQHHKKPGEYVKLAELDQILWPVHCVQDTWGAELASQLKRDRINHIAYKGMDKTVDSYSAFFDNGHQHSTGLHEYLQKNGVTHLTFVGIATDYCVKYSVLDALNLGYTVQVISDACRGVNLSPSDSEKALEEMKHKGASIITSKQLLR